LTVLLAILTFSLSLIGTFLVRSGVLTSVHTFANDPMRGVFILAILVVFIGGALALYGWRAPLLKQGGLFAPISREGALVFNNLFLTTACATVFVGTLYPLALEGALKLKEISYVHAEGYPAAEMKHGPIALIDEHTPSVFLVPRGPMFDKVFSNIEEIKARHGPVIAVATEGDKETAARVDDVLFIPEAPDYLQPIVAAIPLQLLAYHIALLRGRDVDKPRNLAKSVTVE